MFMRHRCSGSPVVADCWRTKSSGVCTPSPSGRSADLKSSPPFLTIASRSAHGISRSASRARPAPLRRSRATMPGLAWLTSATGSPVRKCSTLASSRLLYSCPQRRIGKWITLARQSSPRGGAAVRRRRPNQSSRSTRRARRRPLVHSHRSRRREPAERAYAAHPVHGYCSHGGSRSPSSRSWKRGTKNSFVSVVSITRPVSPYPTTRSASSGSTTCRTARGCGA